MAYINGTAATLDNLKSASGGQISLAAGSYLRSPGQIVQVVPYINKTTSGTTFTTTSSTMQTTTVDSFSITPYFTGSNIMIWGSVFLAYSNQSADPARDQDNKGLRLLKNGSLISLCSNGTAWMFGGFYGTDVPATGADNYSGHYDGDYHTFQYIDTAGTTAGTAITYSIQGWCNSHDNSTTASVYTNHTVSGGTGSLGSSSYLLMEIAT